LRRKNVEGVKFEDVGDLEAMTRCKKRIPEARMLPFELISDVCDDFHFGSVSQRMGAFRKHE
jgi:hypothetical protein